MPVAYCARDGCGHRQSRHQDGGIGKCCVRPVGHCPAFLSSVVTGPPAQPVAVLQAAEADGAEAVAASEADMPRAVAVGQAPEVDAGFPVAVDLATVPGSANVGVAAEADAASPVGADLVAPVGGTELGVYDFYNKARLEGVVNSLGFSVTWLRLYYQTQGSSGMGSVSTYSSAGYKCYVSFKSGFSWEQVASGSDDARWSDIGSFLGGLPTPGAWCFNHEPENDRATYGSNANGDAFRAAFDHIAGIIKPLAPDWMASACLFDEVFPSYPYARGSNWVASPDVEHWIPSSIDLLGVDYYAYRGGSDSGSHWATQTAFPNSNPAITDFLTHATAHGVPLCFPEFGALIKDPAVTPGDEINRTNWFHTISSDWNGKVLATMYFEVNEQDNAAKANYSITDGDHPPMSLNTVREWCGIAGGGSFTPAASSPEADAAGAVRPVLVMGGSRDLAVDSRGTWALKQFPSVASVNTSDVNTALGFSGLRGLSARFPWSLIADAAGNLLPAALDAARDKADAFGVELAVRWNAGRYLPDALYDTMGANYYYTLTTQDPGKRIPLPWNKATGATGNPVFEAAYENLSDQLAAWCRANRVYLMHHPWYGRLWAEYNADNDIQAVANYTLTRLINGNLALMDIAFPNSGPDLAVSFTSSGLFANGTGNTIVNDNRNHMISLWGADNPQIQTLLTGLGFYQKSGTTINPGGSQDIYDGEQMYDGSHNTSYNWAALFSTCFTSGLNWVEVYTTSFTYPGGNNYDSPALQTAILDFNTDWGISP